MSVKAVEILSPTTNLAYTPPFQVVGSVSIVAGPLVSGEGVQIQYTYDGSNWDSLSLNGVLQEIDPDHTTITVNGPAKLRCLKSVTASPCGVYVWESEASR